jgi:hypothetical protein
MYKTIFIILIGVVLGSCRGKPFTQSPIHINPNMDWQPKFEAQEENMFFADNSAMRIVLYIEC